MPQTNFDNYKVNNYMKNITIIFCFFFLNNGLLFSQADEIYKLKYLNNSKIKVNIDTLRSGVSMESFGRGKDSTLVNWEEYSYSKGLNIIFNKDGSLNRAGYCKRVISFKRFFKTGHLFEYRKIGLWIEYDNFKNNYNNHFFYVDKFKYYQIRTDKNGKIIEDYIWFNIPDY